MEIRISEELNRIINYAKEEAMRTGNYGISPDHLFLGIIRHRNNAAAEVLAALGVNLDDMKRSIDERLFTNEPIPFSETDAVTFSRGAHNVLSMTVLEATRLMTTVASPEHLLLALCHYAGGGFGKTMLSDMGVDYKSVLNYMEKAGLLPRLFCLPEKAEPSPAEGIALRCAISVFPEVHAPGKNGSHFICGCGRKLCKAFYKLSGGAKAPPVFMYGCSRPAGPSITYRHS